MKILVSPANYIIDDNSVSEFYYSAKLLYGLSDIDKEIELHVLCGFCANKKTIQKNIIIYELYKSSDVKITIFKRIKFYLWIFYKSIIVSSQNKFDLIWHLLPNGLSSYNLFILLNLHKLFGIKKAMIGRLAQSYGEEETGTFIYKSGNVQVVKNKFNTLKYIYSTLSIINRLYYKRFDTYIFYNEYARQLFSKKLKMSFNETNSKVIPVGFDHKKFNFSLKEIDKTLNFIYLGNLIERKNVKFTIKLFAKILKSGIDAKFFIVGEGYERKKLEHLVQELGIQERVIFKGFIPKSQVETLLKEMHFLFLLSTKEAFGHVLLEALATGTIFIGSDIPPFREIIVNQNNGFLVNIENLNENQQLISFLKNLTTSKFNNIANNGFITSKTFWWDNINLMYLKLIYGTVNK